MTDDDADRNASESRDGGWFDRHQKGAWIAAGATIAAALIAALVPVFASFDDDKDRDNGPVSAPTPAPSVPPAPQSSTPPTAGPTSDLPSSTPSSSATPTGGPLWQGSLLLDSEAKDLDAVPPERAGYSAEGDVYMLYENTMSGWNKTQIAEWSGAAGTLPGLAQCSNVVGTEGSSDEVKLTKRTVLCVRTSDGNIARLKVSKLGDTGLLSSRATFDAVIWKSS